MSAIAHVDGEWSDLDGATVALLDRGFLFGDGVYEVVRLVEGGLFRLDSHLERLEASAAELGFEGVPDRSHLESVAHELVDRTTLASGMLYLQLSRGSGPRRAAFPDEPEPTLAAYVDRVRRDVGERRREGAAAVTVRDIRWARCDVKSTNLLPKVLMKERARRAGAYEALFVDDEGRVHEGASTNLFAVSDDTAVTPPPSRRMLDGITRREIIDIAEESSDREVVTHGLDVDDLLEADELFLTGTLTGVVGVVELDGRAVGGGDVGPVTDAFQSELTRRRRRAVA